MTVHYFYFIYFLISFLPRTKTSKGDTYLKKIHYLIFSIFAVLCRTVQLTDLTLDDSNPPPNWNRALTRGKVDFSRISYIPYIYCNFTLGNSNLPLTRSNFCFPSDYFYTILPSITRNMFCSARQVRKSPKH